MFSLIRQIFSKRPSQSNISAASREFVSKLASSDVWLLVIGLRGIPVVPCKLEDAFLKLDAHRIDVSEIGEEDSVYPLNFRQDGEQMLPIFTSKERAGAFRADSGLVADISYFQPYCFLAGFVATPENEIFALVLDPRSEGERRLSHDERLLLRTLSVPAV